MFTHEIFLRFAYGNLCAPVTSARNAHTCRLYRRTHKYRNRSAANCLRARLLFYYWIRRHLHSIHNWIKHMMMVIRAKWLDQASNIYYMQHAWCSGHCISPPAKWSTPLLWHQLSSCRVWIFIYIFFLSSILFSVQNNFCLENSQTTMIKFHDCPTPSFDSWLVRARCLRQFLTTDRALKIYFNMALWHFARIILFFFTF